MTSSEPVRLRTACAEDLPLIRRIAAASFIHERVHRASVVDLLFSRPQVDPDLRVVAVSGDDIVGFVFASIPPDPPTATGYVDGWAVAPCHRLRGVGTALLAEAGSRLSSAGCRSVQMGGTTWFYAWPGIDFEYTAALLAAHSAGFAQQSVVHNMDVDLISWVPKPRGHATIVRRAEASDGPALQDLIEAHFSAVWQHEVQLVLQRARPTMHVAETDGRLVGFAAHGVYQPDLFGPLGTDPAERGTGIGAALLDACLGDMALAGLPVGQIGWIGPAGFYARAADARIGRTFAVLQKPLG